MSARGDEADGAAAGLGYDPGWTEATWAGAEPPAPLAKPPLARLKGGARLAAFGLLTLALLPAFFLARALGGRLDRRIAALWCAGGAALCGLRLRRLGRPIAGGGALLANHASWLDILVIGACAPVHFVAKAEVAGWPLFGWIGKISNTVFIARKRLEAKAQERLLLERARRGELLCLFPEGTSSDGLRVLPFKTSLFALFFADGASVAAQPCAVCYHAPPGLPAAFYGWWGRRPLFPHIWEVVCAPAGGGVTVDLGAPIDRAALPDRKVMAAEAERRVAQARAAAEAAEIAWRERTDRRPAA